jgi:SAM-dependent methyltransferase
MLSEDFMDNNFFDNYHQYQQGISKFGKIYRSYYLYPRINFYINSTCRLLDIGCGLGNYLQTRKENAYGVDINPHNVSYCKKLGLNVMLMNPGDNYPFDSNYFDSIVLDNVLEHIPNPEHDLKEIFRMLKTGGTVVIGVPGEKGYAHDPDHKVYYDKKKLLEVMKSFHFQFDHGFYTPLPFLFLSKKISQFCFYGFFRKI